MGLLGGLGAGLRGWSGILQEQRKMDWQAKQADLQHQRQLNLENLRNQNQQILEKQRQTFEMDKMTKQEDLRQTALGEQRTYEQGQAESNWVDPESGRMLTVAEYEGLDEKAKGKMQTLKDYELNLADEKLSRAMQSKIELGEQERNAAADAIIEVYGDDPIGRALAEATRAGIDMKQLTGDNKGLSADMIKQAREILSVQEGFSEQPLHVQLQMITEAAKGLKGKGGGMLGGMPTAQDPGKTAKLQEKIDLALSSRAEARKAMQQDDFDKLPLETQRAIMKVGGQTEDQSVATGVKDVPEVYGAKGVGQTGAGVGEGMLSKGREFAQRHTSEGKETWIRNYLRDNPNMTRLMALSKWEGMQRNK